VLPDGRRVKHGKSMPMKHDNMPGYTNRCVYVGGGGCPARAEGGGGGAVHWIVCQCVWMLCADGKKYSGGWNGFTAAP